MIIFAVIASATIALRDVTVQCMIARSVAAELSKRLNADVKIKTFYIRNDGVICIDNVQVNDLYDLPLFRIGDLKAKMSPMILSGELKFKYIEIKDIWGNVVKYEGDDKLNVTQLFSQLKMGADDDDDNDIRLKVDSLRIDNGRVVFWNQNKDRPEKKSMDYFHIDIDSIYGVFSKLEIKHDTVLGIVHTLRGKDRCGLILDDACGDVLFCEKCLNIDGLRLSTNESSVDLDLRFEHNNSSDYYEFVDSVYMYGDIRESTILLSDLRYFAWVLDKMPDKFTFTCDFTGRVNQFLVKDLDAYYGNNTHLNADVAFTGLPEFDNSYIDVDIENMVSSYDDIVSMAIPSSTVTIPLPEMLSGMGVITTKGSFQGTPSCFNTSFVIDSEIGNVDVDVYLDTDESPEYSFLIEGNNLKMNEMFKNDDLSDLTFNLDMNGHGLTVEETVFDAIIDIKSFGYKGNDFNDIMLLGSFEDQRLTAVTGIKHKYLDLDLETGIDFTSEKPEYALKANLKNADLFNLGFSDYDSVMLLSTNVDMKFSGDEIDNILGYLDIKDTRYENGESYRMDNFSANIRESMGIKDFSIDCDFFNFSGSGIVYFDGIMDAFKNNVMHYFNIPSWKKAPDDMLPQEFSFSLVLNDTRQLSRLFMPQLYLARGTAVTATYTDQSYYHGLNIESPEIWFNGLIFKNLDIRNTARFREYKSVVMLDDIIIRDTSAVNKDPISLENVKVVARCGNDTLRVDMLWDDDIPDDYNKAFIRSVFTLDETSGGVLSIKSDDIIINDSIWYINPECNIVFNDDRIAINKLMLYTDTQLMSLNGYYPKTEADTLKMVFNNVDISDFDFITIGHGLDFDGVIDGLAGVSGLNENPAFFTNINIGRLNLNKQEIGDVAVNTSWNDILKGIFVDAEVYKNKSAGGRVKTVDFNGYYFTQRHDDNLDFDLKLNKFGLESVSPFLSSVVTRLNGVVTGNIDVKGSVDEPVVYGKVMMDKAGCSVNFLNTYYTFSDEIRLTRDRILLDDIILRDTLGNIATVDGFIRHDNLRDFYLDLNIKCDDFLALNIPEEKAVGFYGTAITDGTVNIKGPASNINMDVEALTKKGTEISIPLTSYDNMENDFIVFVNKQQERDTTDIVEYAEKENSRRDGGFNINMRAAVNPESVLNIYLPMNMGNINARGSGNVNIGVTPNDFNLHGDYIINSGTFVFTIEMLKKTFSLRQGGSLRWSGDPAEADISVVGVYRTKTSLTSLGSEYADSTAYNNNINVDCIIRLTDKLSNPSLSFAIELPNATDDIKNTVYSVIDTTNQSIMAQQVFSLLVLGSFAYTASKSIYSVGAKAGYNVITGQLSSWLSQISKDFDIGINYTPNDKLTNEELEVALSTQLLDDRLIIEGNFGVIRGDNKATNANNLVGDVDITFRLTRRLSFKAYNHTNIKSNYYLYSFENYSDFTQGLGISLSQSFDNIREIFTVNKKKKAKTPKLKLDDKPKK